MDSATRNRPVTELEAAIERAIEYRRLAKSSSDPKTRDKFMELANQCEYIAADMEREQAIRNGMMPRQRKQV
ncbi:MAG: hypothetical protein HYR63_06215 [Proteobacteria bacterium]|nr:hypothetical protein [Pseudomonadota bacterium]MBI3495930.1 hypothetical protein [Pseudomonadota bacterium]